ncbi:MAG: hypothetical protein JRJ45_10610 [Deltaproteobacteria bacterium]|nr:hypothetical protein [Deltaproteobacteria bacterium]
MLSRKEMFLCLLIVVLLPLSCTRLDQLTTVGASSLAGEKLPGDGSIPVGYGNLISVSSLDQHPHMVQLWFQNEDGELRMVRYSLRYNHFKKVTYLISRK